MQNKRGFIGLPILIAIVVGLIVVGGGTYFLTHQNSASQPAVFQSDTTIPAEGQAITENATSSAVVNTPSAPVESKVLPVQISLSALDCSIFSKSFSKAQGTIEQLTTDAGAYFKTSVGMKQVQLFLAAYYGLDADSIATGSMNAVTSTRLARFQKEHDLLDSGSMNILTQRAMQEPCTILANRIKRNMPIALVGTEPISLSASILFNGDGSSKNAYTSVQKFFAAVQYKNTSTQHVAVIGVPFCGVAVKIYPITDGRLNTTSMYDNAPERTDCEKKDSHVITQTVLPGETISEVVGTPLVGAKLTAGTYELEARPQFIGANLGILKEIFTISPPSATIDTSSLTATSVNGAIISGSANNIQSIIVILADSREAFWHSEPAVPVINGRWTVRVSIDNYTFPAGQYRIIVNDSIANPHNTLPALATGILNVSQ